MDDGNLLTMQVWGDAVKGADRSRDPALAAAAMYVLLVTQANPLWASEHDTAFIRCRKR